jgi:uncharacterized protein (TIGR02996 family)
MSGSKARGFLDDIIAHPDDDAPRLIYADWLEEHGDGARAEFIRVQVESAVLPHWDARRVRLRLRERAQVEQHGDDWRDELPGIRGITWGEFRRGFVAGAAFASMKALQEQAAACWAAAPIEAASVRWPRPRESHEGLKAIAGLRELSVTGTLYNAHREVGRLADMPLLSTLRVLHIADCTLGVEGLRRLLASAHLGNLRVLRVPRNYIGNGGVRALSGAPSLTSLEEIDLSESGAYGRYGEDPIIDATGLHVLADWPGLARLRSLNLSGNYAGRDGLRALLHSPRVTGLKELFLRGNGLTSQAVQEFRDARAGLQLDVLDLGENLLRDRGMTSLVKASCLSELKVLDIDRCEMTTAAARSLAKAPFLASLRRLNVNHNSFGLEGVQAILNKTPPELHTLRVANNDIGTEGAAWLAESPVSDPLLEVDLSQNDLGARAVQALKKASHLRNLLVLRIFDNPIRDAALMSLSESPLGKRLAALEAGEEENPF